MDRGAEVFSPPWRTAVEGRIGTRSPELAARPRLAPLPVCANLELHFLHTDLHGITSFHTHTHHSPTQTATTLLQWFIQYICTTFRAGRQMCCLSASRAHASTACLGWVWFKSGLGNPLSRLLHAVMLMKLLLQ